MAQVIGYNLDTPVSDLTEGKGFGLGDQFTAHNGNVYRYVKAGSAITQWNYVCVDEGDIAYPGTKALVEEGHQVAIAPATFAVDEYGWVAISGRSGLQIATSASVAADTTLYTSGTAGKVDDSASSQAMLAGIVLTAAATTAGNAAVQIGHAGIFTPGSI